MIRAAAWVVAVLLAAEVTDVAARGGRAGGRGGARGGFARGGVAAGGSFGGSAAGVGQRGGYQHRGPAASGTFAGRSSQRREWHQDNVERRQERRDDRQEHADDRRDDWQEYVEEHDEERYQDPVYYYGGYYPYVDDFTDDAAVIDQGVVEPPPNWTLDCDPATVVVGGTTYYRCGSAWYVRVYRGGEIAYTMVNPPAVR
jgi:hypothetical protein